MTLDLKKLEELREKSTQGEWEVWPGLGGDASIDSPTGVVAYEVMRPEDAEFIVALVNAFPELVRKLKRTEILLRYQYKKRVETEQTLEIEAGGLVCRQRDVAQERVQELTKVIRDAFDTVRASPLPFLVELSKRLEEELHDDNHSTV